MPLCFRLLPGRFAGGDGQALRSAAGFGSGLHAQQESRPSGREARKRSAFRPRVPTREIGRFRNDTAGGQPDQADQRHHPIHRRRGVPGLGIGGYRGGDDPGRVGIRSSAVLHADRKLSVGSGVA